MSPNMQTAVWPWIEVNQGLISLVGLIVTLLAFLAAVYVAWHEHREARRAESRRHDQAVASAKALLETFRALAVSARNHANLQAVRNQAGQMAELLASAFRSFATNSPPSPKFTLIALKAASQLETHRERATFGFDEEHIALIERTIDQLQSEFDGV